VNNPKGAALHHWDTNVATYGRDPVTGFALRRWTISAEYGITRSIAAPSRRGNPGPESPPSAAMTAMAFAGERT